MKLSPPVSQYISGSNPSHCSLSNLYKHITSRSDSSLRQWLKDNGYISESDKTTRKALEDGLVDSCDGKVLWNIFKVKQFIKREMNKAIALEEKKSSTAKSSVPDLGEAWVDLEIVGSWFGVSKIVAGRWLDELGLRALPQIEKNESGDYDMLDMSNQAKQKQSQGFISKLPTEKALQRGLARKLTVMKKDKEIEIYQWNLELCKAVLVKAGHQLDSQHKMALKGKGKNSNVKVSGIDKRAQELYVEWAKLYKDPKNKWKIKSLFRGQPAILLEKVENDFMKMPGYLTSEKYLKDC